MKNLLTPFYKNSTSFIFLIVTIILGCYSKENIFDKYDRLVWPAMIAYENKNFEKSLSLFEQAFKVIPDENGSDIFHAAAAALQLGKDDVAKRLIRSAISKTNPSKNYYNNFKGFVSFKSKKLFAAIDRDYKQLVTQFYEDLPYPKEVEDEILKMKEKDKNVRHNPDWNKIAKVDSLNMNRLIEITEKHGWIDKAWILLWHQRFTYEKNNYIWNHFKPLIEKEIKKGKIRKSFFALFDDELSIRESKKQIYGMYQNQFPVIDVETVDERRREIGLPPLWYMNKVYGQTLPVGYSTPIKDWLSFEKWYSYLE